MQATFATGTIVALAFLHLLVHSDLDDFIVVRRSFVDRRRLVILIRPNIGTICQKSYMKANNASHAYWSADNSVDVSRSHLIVD